MIVHVADYSGESPIIPEISHRQPTTGMHRSDPWTCLDGNITECAVTIVVIQDAGLRVGAAQVLLVHFLIHVPVHHQQIRPAIIIKIEESRSPTQILRVQSEARGKSYIVKGAVPVVAI